MLAPAFTCQQREQSEVTRIACAKKRLEAKLCVLHPRQLKT